MGAIVITYESGAVDKALIFGYTLWYYKPWKLTRPFTDQEG